MRELLSVGRVRQGEGGKSNKIARNAKPESDAIRSPRNSAVNLSLLRLCGFGVAPIHVSKPAPVNVGLSPANPPQLQCLPHAINAKGLAFGEQLLSHVFAVDGQHPGNMPSLSPESSEAKVQ